MTSLTWLHFSDLHMKADGVASLDLARMANDVCLQLTRHGLSLDFVAFTGDLAFSGKPAEYFNIDGALSGFLDRLSLCRDRLFVVPGNHDVDRSVIPEHADLHPADQNEAVAAVLLSKPRSVILNRLQSYSSFLKRFFEGNAVSYDLASTGGWHVRNMAIGDRSLSILCLNTAWLATGDDHGKLAIGEPQLSDALHHSTGSIRICLMHHPFRWLRDNEEMVVHRILARECDFVLTGHQHIAKFTQVPFDEKAMMISAGVVHQPGEAQSYHLAHIDFRSGQGRIHTRLFTGLTPDWIDHPLLPELPADGRLSLVSTEGRWRPSKRTLRHESDPIKSRQEFRYSNLYTISSQTLPYITLINSWEKRVNEFRWGDVKIQIEDDNYQLPSTFRQANTPGIIDEQNEGKCRFVRYAIQIKRPPNRLIVTLSKIKYSDYVVSGEHLDESLPNQPKRTFRDEYAPTIDAWHDFSASRLTNICGVGVFLITADNRIIISQHSKHVLVYGNVFSFSSSGTMDWGVQPHPFREIIRECHEEINHNLDADDLTLFSMGIDAKKLYFQFSFFERTARTSAQILDHALQGRDFRSEMEKLHAIPFETNRIVDFIKEKQWEPSAAAGLLTLCAKEFGISKVEHAIDGVFAHKAWENEMLTRWSERAQRDGDWAVGTFRYDRERFPSESEKYAEAVMRFIGLALDGLTVLEIGGGVGRITEKLAVRGARVTCLDLSEEMLERNRKRLGLLAAKVNYVSEFAQEYRAQQQYDMVISSLVLIHNSDDEEFDRLTKMMATWSNTIFLFEHVDRDMITSSHTRTRTEQELLCAFPEFDPERRLDYFLMEDHIVFLKLVRRS
jgi:2-polyprenyl-3-methyl-5-hydroxy-6-metoxy-1,4-benzoquinol methylase